MRDLLEAVSSVTREAAAFALSRWRGEFAHWQKVPGEVVSEIDLAVDRQLRAALGALDPHAGWLSEETKDTPERLRRRRVWVVDPIDGTRDFVRGRRGWCVSVALVEDGAPVLGVLAAPARDEHWCAGGGLGATLNGRAINASVRTELTGARVPADVLPRVDRDLVAVEKPNSIALRGALVADDRADLLATVRLGNEWDLAALAVVAHEAGATVSDALGQPLAFNRPRAELHGIIVCAPAIHAAVVARVREAALRSGKKS